MEKLYEGDGDALQPLLKSLNTFLTQGEPGPQQLRVAMFATRILEATGEYKAPKISIRRYQKRSGEYKTMSKFNISSIAQAQKVCEILQKWTAGEKDAGGDAEGED